MGFSDGTIMVKKVFSYTLWTITVVYLQLQHCGAFDDGNPQSIQKRLNESYTIEPPHQGPSCEWNFADERLLPKSWVANNRSVTILPNDWSWYGGTIIATCGSNNYTYTIENPGETCHTCLKLDLLPPIHTICMNNVLNVTVSTNQLWHPRGTVLTLLVNRRVCSSQSHSNGIVRCDESRTINVNYHSLSYILTPINTGKVIVIGHTNYHGATWFSSTEMITVEKCNTTAMSTSTTLIPSSSTTLMPTSVNKSLNVSTDPTFSTSVGALNTTATLKSSTAVPISTENNVVSATDIIIVESQSKDHKDVEPWIVIVAVASVLILIVVLFILLLLICNCLKRMNIKMQSYGDAGNNDIPMDEASHGDGYVESDGSERSISQSERSAPTADPVTANADRLPVQVAESNALIL